MLIACHDDLDTITAAAGVITAISMDTGTQFYEYYVDRNNASLVEAGQFSQENGTRFYQQDVNLKLKNNTATERNEIAALAVEKLVVIIQDNAGTYKLAGEDNGVEATAAEGTTGVAFADLNGWDLTLTGEEDEPAQEVDSTIITALLSPAP